MLHGFNFSKLVLLSTRVFTYSNTSIAQLLQYQGPILQVCGAHTVKLIVTWLFQMMWYSENHKKTIEG